MTNKHVLVTAIYNYSPRSRMGGRGYDMNVYKAPFLNVIKLGLPIVVFTHENQYDNINNFFEEMGFTDYLLVKYDLETTDITNSILELKERSGLIDGEGLAPDLSVISNDRNHVLCLKKLEFVKIAIENKFFNGQYYHWIDAGLFHHGLFPEDYGGKEKMIRIDEQKYWPNFKQSIFRPGLIDALFTNSHQDFVFIKIVGIHGRNLWWDRLYYDVPYQGHVIGGFFGGNTNTLLEIYEKFNIVTNNLLQQNYLILEEEVLSFVYANYYPDFVPYEFTTWNHDIVTNPCGRELEPDTKCFYKIFKELQF